MSEFHEMCEQYRLPSAHATARAVLDALHVGGHATEVLLQPVTDAVKRLWRMETLHVERLVERRIDLEVYDPDSRDDEPIRYATKHDSMLQVRFRFQHISIDGRIVSTWGEATVELHEARIAYLDKKRKGLSKTIERHREAIRIIKATPDAKTLDDVARMGGAAA